MEKWEIRPTLPQKPLNRSSPKFAWLITSGTPTSTQNFITIRLPPFAPPIMRKCASSDSASFFGSSDSLQPRPLHRFSRSIRQMTRFRARMCLLGVPKTKFYILTPFSPQNRKFLANFRRDKKFRVKKALTMGMLPCKLPLIVIIAE